MEAEGIIGMFLFGLAVFGAFFLLGLGATDSTWDDFTQGCKKWDEDTKMLKEYHEDLKRQARRRG